jgi:hypothetical protein
MHEVRADLERNCLFVTLRGYLRDNDAAEAAGKVIAESNKLTSGFTIVNDISDAELMEPSAAEHIKSAQQHVMTRGVGRTIRIVGNATAVMQFNRTYREVEGDYEVICVSSMDEALERLS